MSSSDDSLWEQLNERWFRWDQIYRAAERRRPQDSVRGQPGYFNWLTFKLAEHHRHLAHLAVMNYIAQKEQRGREIRVRQEQDRRRESTSP